MKFCGLINFLFTFRKAVSNTECAGQQKSDSFTTDKLCAGSVIRVFVPWLELQLKTKQKKDMIITSANSKSTGHCICFYQKDNPLLV